MPSEELEVIEVLGRAEQGMQEPFQCIAEDGNLYYVKGRQTDRASLCNEWVCAHLASELGLPLPSFKLLNISEAILEELPFEWKAIGLGPAFGSMRRPGCAWLDIAQVQHIPVTQQFEIFGFDWWIQNIDRTDGNPNLLWDARQEDLVIIDHNLAFDREVNPKHFLENHIFRRCFDSTDLVTRVNLQTRFNQAMDAVFHKACDNIPPEWHWNNPECDVPAAIDLDAVTATLTRCQSTDFWRFS